MPDEAQVRHCPLTLERYLDLMIRYPLTQALKSNP
jgi:hypothetical protein